MIAPAPLPSSSIEQFDFRFRPDLKRQAVLRYLDPTFVEQAGTLTTSPAAPVSAAPVG